VGDAIKQVGQRSYPNWGVGVEISIPIGLRTGLGERDRLRAEVSRAEQVYIEQARLLEEQIRNSHRRLLNGKQRLQAAREGVAAAEEQVRIGMIDFYNGRTTAFELVRLGADFATAQQRYSQALVRTAKAAAILKQLTSGAYPSDETY
jgi:outer membrane protein TolC